MVEQGQVLFQQGDYKVESAGVEYAIVNVRTGVVEETTSFLFEAIRLAKIYNQMLAEAVAFQPKTFDPNGDKGEKTELPKQLN